MNKRTIIVSSDVILYKDGEVSKPLGIVSCPTDVEGNNYIFIESMKEFIDSYCKVIEEYKCNVIVYFPNLTKVYPIIENALFEGKYIQKSDYMGNCRVNFGAYIYSVNRNSKNVYSITINTNCDYKDNYYLRFYSLDNIIPVNIKNVSKDFGLKENPKDYFIKDGKFRFCDLNVEESIKYLNDVRIQKEVIPIIRELGINGTTIGSSALKDFKSILKSEGIEYNDIYPTLGNVYHKYSTTNISRKEFKKGRYNRAYTSIDSPYKFARRAYSGGICILNDKYKGKVIKKGYCYDINSSYSYSGYYPGYSNKYRCGILPYGMPTHYLDENHTEFSYNSKIVNIKEFLGTLDESSYAIVHFKANFDLKKDGVAWLSTNNITSMKSDKVKSSKDYNKGNNYEEVDGEIRLFMADMYMTEDDMYSFFQNYDVHCIDYIECDVYSTNKGILNSYVDKWFGMKLESKGKNKSKYACSKLMNNGLIGKFGKRNLFEGVSSVYEEGTIKDKKDVSYNDGDYIPLACAVLSKSRRVLLDGITSNIENFIYTDTDSLQLSEEAKPGSIPLDDFKLGYWKLEAEFVEAFYSNKKRYIYRKKDGEVKVVCSGIPRESIKMVEAILSNKEVKIQDEVLNKFYQENRGISLKNLVKSLQIPYRVTKWTGEGYKEIYLTQNFSKIFI